MAVKCCSCNYVMSTKQEIQSAIIKAGFDIRDIFFGGLVQNALAGHLNSGRNAIKCPRCGEKGRFEDV